MKKGKCCIVLLLTIVFLLFNYKPVNAAIIVTSIPLSDRFEQSVYFKDSTSFQPYYIVSTSNGKDPIVYAPPGSYIYGYRFNDLSGGELRISTATGQNFLVSNSTQYISTNNNWGSWIRFTSTNSPYYTYLVDLEIFIATPVADEVTVIQARDASNNAASYASWANANADQAKLNAWYSGSYGGSSESVGNVAGYIRNTQLPGIDTKITNLQTAVTNINNSIGNDTTAPVIKVKTVSGARATSAGSINVVISGADNKDPFTALQYSVNGGAYTPMPANGIINIPVNISPITTTTIAVKDSAGNIATELISIRKL